MCHVSKRIVLIIPALMLSLGFTAPMFGAVKTWNATSTDMTKAGNWTGGLPGPTDTGEFAGGLPKNPGVFHSGGVSNTLSTGTLDFSSSDSYTLTVDGANQVGTASLGLSVGGVTQSGSAQQTFNVVGGGIMTFSNASAAGDSTITYNVNSGSLPFLSTLQFKDTSSAGTANINVQGVVLNANAKVLFKDHSTSANSKIDLNTFAEVVFSDFSNAGSSSLNTSITKSGITFIDSASASNATMVVSTSSILVYNSNVPSSAATVSLLTGSAFEVKQDFALNKVTSDSSGLIQIFPGITLTVGDASTGNIFPGTINFGGALAKQGTGDLSLTNPNNAYLGGTSVLAGTLIVNSSSLPVGTATTSATVNNAGTLEFAQFFDGTFSGNILLNSPLATLLATGGAKLTFDHSVTGSGKLSLNNSHVILTNSGNTYSGGTQVPANNILEGTGATLQGSIANDGQVIFNQASNSTFGGNISSTTASALITKTGTGTVIFANPNPSFQGQTQIEQGTLLTDNVLGGSVTIFPGGTLGGIGSIAKNVQNNGFISPGNSIGTLSIGGDYQQTFAGTYIDEIDGQGNSDLINIGGSASLAGTLLVVSLDGVIDSTKTYTILHAAGGVSGAFAKVTAANPMLLPIVHYHSHDVTFNIHSVFENSPTNHNQHEVADQLISITNPTPAELAILTELAHLVGSPDTANQALRALSQMSGEQYTNCLWIAETTNRQFLRRLYDPLRAIMTAGLVCSCNSPAFICDRGQYYTCADWEPVHTCDLSAWLEMGGGHTFMEHDRNATGFKMDSFEIAGGTQMALDSCWTVGVAGEYAHDHIHYNVGGSARSTSGLVGLYSLYRPKGYYLLADVVLDYNTSKVKRQIVIGDIIRTAHGNPKSFQETLYVEGGFDWNCHCFLVQPFLGVEADFFQTNKFCEHGASPLNLRVYKKCHTNAYSRLGVHLSAAKLCWTMNVDLAWQCRLTSFRNTLDVKFLDFGAQFPILGVHVPRNSLDATVNVTAALSNGWEFYAEIACERWAHAANYTALGGLKFSW